MVNTRIKSYSEFSNEDRQIIRENIGKIQSWVKNQKLTRFEIAIPNDVYKFKFFIDSKKCYLSVGGGTYNFERSNNNDYDERYWIGTNNAIPYAFEVIRNWKEIKEEILKTIEFEEKSKSLLYNFEV